MIEEITLHCPSCQKEIALSLQRVFGPKDLESLLSLTSFHLDCPFCQGHFPLAYSVVYVDEKTSLLIFLDCQDGFGLDQVKKAIPKWKTLTCRRVPSLLALRDKLLCQVLGQDDRLMEVVRSYGLARYQQEHPKDQIHLSYFEKEGQTTFLKIVIKDDPTRLQTLKISHKVWTYFENRILDHLPQGKAFDQVDLAWLIDQWQRYDLGQYIKKEHLD